MPSFLAPVNYGAGSGVTALATGDFNGDGVPDLVALASGPSAGAPSLAVLLGNGDGTFQPAVFTAGAGQSSPTLVVASFTTDGLPDVLVRVPDGNLAVMLNNGDGSFQPPLEVPGTTSRIFAVGDLTGSGIADLVVATNTVQVYLGRGDGTFQLNATIPLPAGSATGAAVADFTGDGTPDVLVTDVIRPGQPAGFDLLVGNGDGTFQDLRRTAEPTLSFSPAPLIAVDLNNDGAADLITANGPGISVWLNNGDGTFRTPVNYSAGLFTSIAVRDVNGDGYPDLLFPAHSQGAVKELLNNGDGTFRTGPDRYVGTDLTTLTVFGDFNGDGALDLATVLPNSHGVGVRLGNPDGTFQTTPTLATGNQPTGVVTGDFNGDGIPDFAVANSDYYGDSPSVSVFLGNGDGTFQPAQVFATGPDPFSIVAAGFHHDQRLDLVVSDDDGVKLYAGNGDGTFGQPVTISNSPAGLAVGDFNGDGLPDLVLVGRSGVSLLPGNGDGTFQPARLVLAGVNGPVAVGDFTGDRYLGLAVLNQDAHSVVVLLGNGDGTFQPAQSYDVGQYPEAVAAGDLTGAGRDDLVISGLDDLKNDGPGDVNVFLSNPDGTFGAPAAYPIGTDPGAVVIADFSGDGQPDVAVEEGFRGLSAASVRVLLGNGDGTFQVEPVTYSLGVGISVQVAAGDWNGDGQPDLVTTNTLDDSVSLLVNTGTWPSGTPHRGSRPGARSREGTLTGDFFRAWPLAAPRKDSPIRDGMALLTPADFRTERGDDGRIPEPVPGAEPDSPGPPRPAGLLPGTRAWAEPRQSLFPILDEVLADPTGP